MPEVKTITVTTSNYNTEVADVIRGQSGVTAHPQVTMQETLANAYWFDELHETPSEPETTETPSESVTPA